ncbi:MAG: hypothetical protein LBQ58_04500 [Synergistaceae bacterium]|jgi:hypothetical protein|nr:hypothetical protein [Synergistaceae bacterium]
MFFERNGADSFSIETVVAKMAAGTSELCPRIIFVAAVKMVGEFAHCSRRLLNQRFLKIRAI